MQNKKSVLITGCSKGFGLLFAEELAKENYIVYATARNLNEAPNLTKLAEDYSNITILELDVTNPDHLYSVISRISEEQSKLDILINNAGYGLLGKADELDLAKLKRQFDINVFAPVEITKQCLSLLHHGFNGGLVINISSIASYLGLPTFGAYSATKTALNHLSMSLAIEQFGNDLSVAVIQPGPFETEFSESASKLSERPYRAKKGSGLFSKREDPIIVSNLVKKIIRKKEKNSLPAYTEYPVGKGANLLRLASRWLPLSLFVKLMSKGAYKSRTNE
ncbi:MAG TPA: SDR family NAD(P)-dependent oxidoreductase [Vampirovibrionales bacterium]